MALLELVLASKKSFQNAFSDHRSKLIDFMCNLLVKRVIFEFWRAHGFFGLFTEGFFTRGPLYRRIFKFAGISTPP